MPKTAFMGQPTAILYADEADFEAQGAERYNAAKTLDPRPYRMRYRDANGRTFLADTIGGPVQNDDGELEGFIGFIRPVSRADQSASFLQDLMDITSDPTLAPAERIEATLRLGTEHFGLSIGIYASTDADDYVVQRVVGDGIDAGQHFSLSDTYCALTLEKGRSWGFHHAGAGPMRVHPVYRTLGLEAYIGCPIRVGGQVHGTVNFSSQDVRGPFSSDDFAAIEALTHTIGHILEREEDRERLERLAQTDPLTGLWNRRRQHEHLTWNLDHARRTGRPLSVVWCDLDHFKQVNDRFGHPGGDRVLKHFAQICRRVTRSDDLIGRMGGEEFLLILPDTAVDGAEVVGERLLRTLEATPLALDGEWFPISASLGVAEAGMEETAASLLQRADEAMYAAKDAGRATLRTAR